MECTLGRAQGAAADHQMGAVADDRRGHREPGGRAFTALARPREVRAWRRRLQEVEEQSIRTLEMSYLAKHAFVLAQSFNSFYHKHHILSEKDPTSKCFYLTVANTARLGLIKVLNLLGIEIPEKM